MKNGIVASFKEKHLKPFTLILIITFHENYRNKKCFQLPNNNGITPLHLFAKNGVLEAVQLIVSKDAEAPLSRTKDGKTPEDMATASGRAEVAKWLKDHCEKI